MFKMNTRYLGKGLKMILNPSVQKTTQQVTATQQMTVTLQMTATQQVTATQ